MPPVTPVMRTVLPAADSRVARIQEWVERAMDFACKLDRPGNGTIIHFFCHCYGSRYREDVPVNSGRLSSIVLVVEELLAYIAPRLQVKKSHALRHVLAGCGPLQVPSGKGCRCMIAARITLASRIWWRTHVGYLADTGTGCRTMNEPPNSKVKIH